MTSYLCQLHHHVGKDMKKPHNGIPQPAVCQRLLVACAWALTSKTMLHSQQVTGWSQILICYLSFT